MHSPDLLRNQSEIRIPKLIRPVHAIYKPWMFPLLSPP